MGDLRTDKDEVRRRAGTRDAVPAPAHRVPAGVSNHLLARALSTGNPPPGVTLQRVFEYKNKKIPSQAGVPKIHGVSPADLTKLALDPHDYAKITDAASVAAAMEVYEANHRIVVDLPALDETYAGYQTVWNDDEFAEHDGQQVRATFQLDSMQGKHDEVFASDPDARKKTGGAQMPPGSDYETLAQGVPAALAGARLGEIFGKASRAPVDFAVQKRVQADGLHYEISARWAPLGEGLHLLVYYHCYPPR